MARILTFSEAEGLHGKIAIDVETSGGFSPHLGRLEGLGIWAEDAGVIGYLPTHESPERMRELVRTWKEGSWLFAHNLKYEARWLGLGKHDLRRFRIFDVQVAEHLLDENVSKDLGSVEARRLGTSSKRKYLEEAKSKGLSIKDTSKWPQELLSDYCVNDCRVTFLAAQVQSPMLRKLRLEKLFNTLMRYLAALQQAEQRGMLIDMAALESVESLLDKAIEAGTKDWRNLLREYGVSYNVNIRSPAQVSKLLYETIGLEKPVVSEEAAYTVKAAKQTSTATSKDLLKKLNHPVSEQVLYLKQLGTVKGYLNSYRKLADTELDGLVLYPEFNVSGTVTGRLSSKNPNVQQIKASVIETPQGDIDIRSIFRAREGNVIVAIDYQQMEAAVFGLLAKDPVLTRMVMEGADIHEATAHLMFGGYDSKARRVVKTLNFGILYGLGRAGLAEALGESLSAADKHLEDYMKTFPRVRPFMREVEEELARKGFLRYWSGRIRRIKDRKKHYIGVNSIVQGGCADAVAEAVIKVSDLLDEAGGHLLAVIHDELVMEVPKESWEELVPRIQEAMEVPHAFGVPLRTDAFVDEFWKCT